MKVTRKSIRKMIFKVIQENINMPDPSRLAPLEDDSLYDYGFYDDEAEQQDFLEKTHGTTARLKLPVGSSRPDYDRFLEDIGVQKVDQYKAKEIANSIPAPSSYDEPSSSLALQLQNQLAPVFNLVVTNNEFMKYVQGRTEDPQQRPILVDMGSDEEKVVFKDIKGDPVSGGAPNYYVYYR